MADDAGMSQHLYRNTLETAYMIANLAAANVELISMALKDARRAETMGPFFDPTLWQQNGEKLRQDIEMLERVHELGRAHSRVFLDRVSEN